MDRLCRNLPNGIAKAVDSVDDTHSRRGGSATLCNGLTVDDMSQQTSVQAKPVLTVRCPAERHRLAEVIWESGRAVVIAQEAGSMLAMPPIEKMVPVSRRVKYDLREAADDMETITVACKCGSRHLSMIGLNDEFAAGRTGVSVLESPLFP